MRLEGRLAALPQTSAVTIKNLGFRALGETANSPDLQQETLPVAGTRLA
jgi:hypothetical protein